MSKKSEIEYFARLLARKAKPPNGLLEDSGLWATVFFEGFRPVRPAREDEDDDDDDDDFAEHQDSMLERFFPGASPPAELDERPQFTFLFPKRWSWHTVLHGGGRGGLSHALSRDGEIEPVAQLDGHPDVWSELTVQQLKTLAGAALETSPTHPKVLAPLLYTAAIPADEKEREALERWMAKELERAGIRKGRRARELASALALTTPRPQKPKTSVIFRRFLKDLTSSALSG